jgi:hypothetical protein
MFMLYGATYRGLDHGGGHPPAASGPCYRNSALEARRVRGLRRDAERAQIAETVSKVHALFLRFSQERGAVIIQAPGLLYISRAAYFLWAVPPNGGCTAQRHGAVHRRTTSALRPASKVSRVDSAGTGTM